MEVEVRALRSGDAGDGHRRLVRPGLRGRHHEGRDLQLATAVGRVGRTASVSCISRVARSPSIAAAARFARIGRRALSARLAQGVAAVRRSGIHRHAAGVGSTLRVAETMVAERRARVAVGVRRATATALVEDASLSPRILRAVAVAQALDALACRRTQWRPRHPWHWVFVAQSPGNTMHVPAPPVRKHAAAEAGSVQRTPPTSPLAPQTHSEPMGQPVHV